jgi:hypothetical protein
MKALQIFVLTFFFSFSLGDALLAQADAQYVKGKAHLDESQLEKLKQEHRWEKPEPTEGVTKKSYFPKFDWGNLAGFSDVWKYILFAVVLSILVVLIVWLIQSQQHNTKMRKDRTLLFDVESDVDVKKIDWRALETMLAQAEQEQNYRHAMRILFLLLLKNLQNIDYIKTAKGYTNAHYLQQMRAFPPLLNAFQNLLRFYEVVWYGERTLENASYSQVKRQWSSFVDTLPKK